MSYEYSQEELALPPFSGRGEPKPCYVAYLAETIPLASRADFLNRKAVDGWELVSVDEGVGYFKRAEFRVYEDVGTELIRVQPGENA